MVVMRSHFLLLGVPSASVCYKDHDLPWYILSIVLVKGDQVLGTGGSSWPIHRSAWKVNSRKFAALQREGMEKDTTHPHTVQLESRGRRDKRLCCAPTPSAV